MRAPSVWPIGTSVPGERVSGGSNLLCRFGRLRRRRRAFRFCWILTLLLLFTGCIHIPISSETVIRDELQTIPFLEQGEVLLVSGENAAVSERAFLKDYVTAGCQNAFQGDTIGELIKSILKANPQPGRFAVRHVKALEKEEGAEPTPIEGDSILGQLKLSRDRILKDRLRYVVHVKEGLSVSAHVPLYLPPFGVASCGNRAILEAELWDLPTERSLGSLTVTAEAEFTVVAYMLHLVLSPDTQRDATERLARIIIEKLTGMKSLEAD